MAGLPSGNLAKLDTAPIEYSDWTLEKLDLGLLFNNFDGDCDNSLSEEVCPRCRAVSNKLLESGECDNLSDDVVVCPRCLAESKESDVSELFPRPRLT